MEALVRPIDDLWWTATKYSNVLNIDARICKQALETVPCKMMGKRQVWHVRDGMPAIFRPANGTADPKKLSPKDRLDHYRAERERIKLEQETGTLLTALEVSTLFTRGMKEQKDVLTNIRATVEHHCDVSIDVLSLIEQIVDRALEETAETWRKLAVDNE